MKTLQPFPLPSEPKSKIVFREPNVGDALEFCDINPDREEEATTQYLNRLQHPAPGASDAALWTAQDRLSALWWIYVSTNTNTSLLYDYPCAHCGDKHPAVIDLVDLDDGYRELDGKKRQPFTMASGGQNYPITIHPIDGRGMTHLQALNVEKEEAQAMGETGRVKMLDAQLRLFEVVHSITLDKPTHTDWEQQTQEKYDLVCSMHKERELTPLVASVELRQREQRHGLLCHLSDGRLSLVSPPQPCPVAKEEGQATAFLLGFRLTHFIPEI